MLFRSEFLVEDYEIGIEALDRCFQFVGFAGAEEGGGVGGLAKLGDGGKDFCPGADGETVKFF